MEMKSHDLLVQMAYSHSLWQSYFFVAQSTCFVPVDPAN